MTGIRPTKHGPSFLEAEDDYYELLDDYTDYQDYVTSFENAYTDYEEALEKYEIYKSQQVGENTGSYELQRQAAELTYRSALKAVEIPGFTPPSAGWSKPRILPFMRMPPPSPRRIPFPIKM